MTLPIAMRAMSRPTAADASLAAKVAFLSRPAHYAEPTSRVESVETHMSWVFLADGFAYKLKKPVRNADVDLRTLSARQFNCNEEVRLNRRLTRDVYLGVTALRRYAAGALTFAGDGEIVDWLVKMRRLPADRMLDRLIRRNAISGGDVDSIVARLCDFYRRCPPIGLLASEYRRQFREDVAANRLELSQPAYALSPDLLEDVFAAQLAFVAARGNLLDARVRDGRIVEGHGDLRPEHVCVEAEPQIIDCLEFSRVLRTQDVADEFGYLALECERLGARQLRAGILESYRRRAGDCPPDELVHFYQSHRACVRATLALRHVNEPALPNGSAWRLRAGELLALAKAHCAACASRS